MRTWVAALCAGLFAIALAASTGADAGFRRESGTNRAGADYRSFFLRQSRVELCEQACASDPKCQAYVYEKARPWLPSARCWLKERVPRASRSSCCIAGVRVVTKPPRAFLALPLFATGRRTPARPVRLAPPVGLRAFRPSRVTVSCASQEFLQFSVLSSDQALAVTSTIPCFPYRCNRGKKSCETRCTPTGGSSVRGVRRKYDSGCAAGFDCLNGRCVAPRTFCAKQDTSASTNGKTDWCGGYACNPVTGLCKRDCVMSNDCARGFVCDTARRFCIRPQGT